MGLIKKLETRWPALYDVLVGAVAAVIIFMVGLLVMSMLNGCTSSRSNWSREDTYRQAAYTAVWAVDTAQTLEIANNPDEYYEANPLAAAFIGEHPSTEAVLIGGGLSYAAVTTVSYFLSPEYRKWFQYFFIGVHAAAVGNNFSIGLGFGF